MHVLNSCEVLCFTKMSITLETEKKVSTPSKMLQGLQNYKEAE